VLYFVDPADNVMLMGLTDVQGHNLRNVDEANIDVSDMGTRADDKPQSDAMPEDSFTTLREMFISVLGDRVKDVRSSKNLVGSPARLVSDDQNPTRNMYRINRLLEKEYELPVKILELNPRHPLLYRVSERLATNSGDEMVMAIIEQVFENALLQDGIHPDPAGMAERLVKIMQAAME